MNEAKTHNVKIAAVTMIDGSISATTEINVLHEQPVKKENILYGLVLWVDVYTKQDAINVHIVEILERRGNLLFNCGVFYIETKTPTIKIRMPSASAEYTFTT